MTHLDLFSGIGGFAYAIDQVWPNVEHIFCDNDKFCREVLRKHWPEAEIYEDIRAITDTERKRRGAGTNQGLEAEAPKRDEGFTESRGRVDILTGGFPCQPFSAAGLRRGTADERHLWPEMLRIIRLTAPEWVVAENVRGLVTWNDGLVLEQVCADLEAAGYEVQSFIIPAIAVNAPHRRDRIWFVAHRTSDRRQRKRPQASVEERHSPRPRTGGQLPGRPEGQDSWNRDWSEVAAQLCSLDDGLPASLDGLELSKSQHRKEQLKAYGNAIVPQVAIEIMLAIRYNRGNI